MGGLNASIVLPDADVEAAAKVIAGAAMGYAGPEVHRDRPRDRRRRRRRRSPTRSSPPSRRSPIGDPADASTVVGPVINPPARDERRRRRAGAPRDGGRVATGGQALDGPGLFVTPTVVDGQSPDAAARAGGGVRADRHGPARRLGRAGRGDLQRRARSGSSRRSSRSDLDAALTVVDGLETGHDPRQHADLGRRLPRAVRRREAVVVRPARAGQGRARALHVDAHDHDRAGRPEHGALARPHRGGRAARPRAGRGRPDRAAGDDARSTRCSPRGSLDARGRRAGAGRLDRARAGRGPGGVGGGRDLRGQPHARATRSPAGTTSTTCVYDAERPELFFKAAPGRVRGPGGAIGVRADSGWDVPEPELALVIARRRRDRRLHDRQRRLLALDRGREPALPAAGQGLPRLLRARPVHRAGGRGAGPRGDGDPADDRARRRGRLRGLDAGRAAASASRPSSCRLAVPRAGFPGRRRAAHRTSIVPARSSRCGAATRCGSRSPAWASW